MRTKTPRLASTVDKSQLRNPTENIHSWKLSVTVHSLTVLIATKAYLIFDVSRGEEMLEKKGRIRNSTSFFSISYVPRCPYLVTAPTPKEPRRER